MNQNIFTNTTEADIKSNINDKSKLIIDEKLFENLNKKLERSPNMYKGKFY